MLGSLSLAALMDSGHRAASMDAGGPNGQRFEHGRAAFKLRCSQVS